MCPYTCLSEDCAWPPLFFAHKRDWLKHMKNIHSADWIRRIHTTTWYCDSGHDLEQFKDLESDEDEGERHEVVDNYEVNVLDDDELDGYLKVAGYNDRREEETWVVRKVCD